jgi:hypothetical protein
MDGGRLSAPPAVAGPAHGYENGCCRQADGCSLHAAFFLHQYMLILIAFFIIVGASADDDDRATMLQGKRIGASANPRIGGVTPETPLGGRERFRQGNRPRFAWGMV